MTNVSDATAPPAAAAASARRARRRMSNSTKRVLIIVLGVILIVGSVLGFYLTADAFDERVPVTVAAIDLQAGQTVSAVDFAPAMAIVGDVPHLPWTPTRGAEFEGLVAAAAVPANSLIRADMFIEPDTVPVGVTFEVEIPLDLTLATDGVSEFEEVLLVDPGADPTAEVPGRPRQVVRPFTLRNFEGSSMRLFVEPEEFADWERLLADVGGTLMVVPLGIGGDPQETSDRLNAVWLAQWTTARDEVEAQAEAARPGPGPGEMEIVVSFDTGLVPTEIGPDDLVLLVDPGADPVGIDQGRPRQVIDTLQLQGFDGSQMQMFVPPEQWHYWRSLPEELGGTPMLLPLAEGTDIDDIAARLNDIWNAEWQADLEDHLAGR